MNWLLPGFLAGALAVGIPVALHLLRRWPRRPVVFPSLQFLTAGRRQTEHGSQRLRRWLILALRCAVFALLAAGFARPFHGGPPARPVRAVVVVIDNSFSLQATGRWEALRHWARDQIGSLAAGDKLGLLLMAPQPTWLIAPTADTTRPLQILATLSPGWLTARAEPALRLAGETLANLPADWREIIVLSDYQRLSWSGTDFERKLSPGVTVVFPPPTAAAEPQAAVLTPVLSATDQGIVASVPIYNFTGAQMRTLRIYRDGALTPIREENIELKPQELRAFQIHLSVPPDRPASFRFALDTDSLPADDTAYAVWQPAGDGSLLLDPAPPGEATDFVATALAVTMDLKPTLRITPTPAGNWPARGLAVLRNDASFAEAPAGQLDAFLTTGGSALMFATGGPNQKAWLARHGVDVSPLPKRAEAWRVHDWAMDHPLVVEFSRRQLEVLTGWEFYEGWALPVDAATSLARWNETAAAIAEMRVGAGTILVCGFTPDRRSGDWPATPSFVPFLHQAVAYLFCVGQTAVVAGQTGRPLTLTGGPGEWQAIEGPAAGEAAMSVSGSVVPMTPGIYQFTRGADRKRFAVNLPPEESDPTLWGSGTPWLDLISRQPANETKGLHARLAAVDAEQQAPLWWWAIAAAALLMMAEVTLANRTTR